MLIFLNLSLAQSTNQVQESIDNFVANSALKNAAISFAAYDLEESKIIASYNPAMALSPASTVKLFSTALAFETLGSGYIPKTRFYHTGEIDSLGVLHGDLIIRGGGDPSLGSRFFTTEENRTVFLDEWIALISASGIKTIKGNIVADASDFGYEGAPDGWSWSDLGNYYGSGPSGLVIYDNMTKLHFSTSAGLNEPTFLDSMTPPVKGYQLMNSVTTYNSNRDNCYVYGAPFSYDRFAVGNLPNNKKNFEVKASIPDPELMTAQVFLNKLNTDSIFVAGEAIGQREQFKAGSSAINYDDCKFINAYGKTTIKDIAFWTNLRSVNLFAEQLLSLVAYEKTSVGQLQKGANYSNGYWEPRLNIEMFQTDGSGLSRSNGFSAQHFIKLLEYMQNSEHFADFKSTLPIAGKSGTLRGVCRGQAASNRLSAKSGTMNRIKSYAGYVDSVSGKQIAFALIVNNDNLSNYNLVKEMEKVFNAMANY
jgi:D-alanyl-D-alanine carboxypeptidase/D-alanyl-D-alanine-endopeptidase (penicillin-binding protein 4)